MAIDHLRFNQTKYYPIAQSITGNYTISGGNGVGGGLGSIEIKFKITQDGKLILTYASGGEGEIDLENMYIERN